MNDVDTMNGDVRPGLSRDAEAVLRDARWSEVPSGDRSRVWRCTFGDGRPPLAVKAPATGAHGAEAVERAHLLRDEAERLGWLAAHLALPTLHVPEIVVAPVHDAAVPVLVTKWIDAEPDLRLLGSATTVAQLFGRALAEIHDASRRIDLDDCPFDASLAVRLAELGVRVANDVVDTSRFVEPFDRYTPAELLERVERMAAVARDPEPEDRVLVHGDLCVTNLLVDVLAETPVAALDWASAGVGDRHQDLAITARSLLRNFGGEALPTFFAAYDFDPDPFRLEVYALAEELF